MKHSEFVRLTNLYERILKERYNNKTNTYDFSKYDKAILDAIRNSVSNYIPKARQHDDESSAS